jgi:hypothetical protein
MAFCEKPSLEESNIYGNFLFADDQMESIFYPLAPRLSFKEMFLVLIGFNCLPPAAWLPAVKVRSDLFAGILITSKIIAIGNYVHRYRQSIQRYFSKYY